MKIVTNILSSLASAVDVVDRDITSNVDVQQQALFPMIAIPHENIDVAGPVVVQRKSFRTTFAQQNTNVGAGTSSKLLLLGRGLWRLKLSLSIFTNYLAPPAPFVSSIVVGKVVGDQAALSFIPGLNVAQFLTQDFDLLALDDLTGIWCILGGNGVGDTQNYNASIWGQKYF